MEKLISIDEERIRKEMEYWNIPGMAVSLIQADVPDQFGCFGWRDKENDLAVTEDTQFCIASCSKSMTATLVAALVDKGLLDFDVPIYNYVPKMQMWDDVASKQMTIRDMLCHRTGLGGYDIIWPNTEGREKTAERLRYLKPNKPFRFVSQYSNLMYIMIGYVAESVTGHSWPELMKKYVFDPLCMDRTNCRAVEITGNSNHAEPYQVVNGILTKLPFWNVDMAGPAASVNSTARDMAKWLHFHIDGGKNQEGKQVISEKVFKQMHEIQIPCDDLGRPDEDCYTSSGYGLGWRIGSYRGIRMQKHSGKIEGYSTFQAYLPDEKKGVFIALNLHSPSSPVFYPVVYSMLDEIFGFEDCGWFERFRDNKAHAMPELYEDCMADFTKDVLKGPLQNMPFPWGKNEWIGTYDDPGYGKLKIEEEKLGAEKKLYLTYRDQKLLLRHWGANQFWMDGVKSDILTIKVPVTLKKENNKHLVYVGYEPLTGPARFIKLK